MCLTLSLFSPLKKVPLDKRPKGLELGAIDYITKPFVSKLLNKRVELHLRLLEQDEKLRRFNTQDGGGPGGAP
ncbi:hypothetical protein AGMMS49546_01610 [Spirochaetia bacterium]|nr:hypothetical protein AGMMS49546_01610 [Spirochaetia bacterium]